jgi:transcriptional regulator with XRE-family HTH domain
MDERNSTRAKILGVLIQDARRHAARSVEQCAHVVNLSPEQFAAAEAGQHVLSLPELEVLAIYLDVPMAHFWGSQTLGETPEPDYSDLLALRHKIVGGLLKQARLDAGMSSEEVAERVDVSVETLNAYEMGEQEVPFLHLEELARILDVSIDYFLDGERGPLGQHEAQHEMNRYFRELPADVRAFVSRPVNIGYLQTAMRLSEMDADQLRNIAAGILEITY